MPPTASVERSVTAIRPRAPIRARAAPVTNRLRLAGTEGRPGSSSEGSRSSRLSMPRSRPVAYSNRNSAPSRPAATPGAACNDRRTGKVASSSDKAASAMPTAEWGFIGAPVGSTDFSGSSANTQPSSAAAATPIASSASARATRWARRRWLDASVGDRRPYASGPASPSIRPLFSQGFWAPEPGTVGAWPE